MGRKKENTDRRCGCLFCVCRTLCKAIHVFIVCIFCGCCPRRHAGREKAKRRNVLFEVAEATMVNWTRQMSLTEAGSHNIYVEVFLEGAGTRATCARYFQKCCAMLCCIICCKRRGKKGKAQRGRTPSIPEAREMHWRIFNEEWFLVALFSLGQQRLKLHEGDQVNVVAEVYRVEKLEEEKAMVFKDEPSDCNAMRIAVMRGSFKAGTLGLVTLWLHEDNREDREKPKEDSDARPVHPHLNLELRPTSSRAFKLEEAQPRSKEETIESIHAELVSQKSAIRRMGGRRFSILSGDRGTGSAGSERAMGRVSSTSKHSAETASTSKTALYSENEVTGRRRSWNKTLTEAAVGVPNMMTRVTTAASRAIGARGSPTRKRKTSFLENTVDRMDRKASGSNDDLGHDETDKEAEEGRRTSQRSGDSSNGDARSSVPVQGHTGSSWLLDRQKFKEGGGLEDLSIRKESSLRTSREGRSEKSEKKSVNFRTQLARGVTTSMQMRKKDTDTSSRPSHASSTLGARMSRERSEWGAGLRRLKRELFFGGKSVSTEPRPYDSWIPTDWATTWKNPWPVESDDLAGKHEVVPLMEAEFRRDCVVFFNTLFPRTQTTAFRIIREFALTMPTRRKMSHPNRSVYPQLSASQTRKSVYSQVNTLATKVSIMKGSLWPSKTRLVDEYDLEVDSPLPTSKARLFMAAEDSIASTSLSHQSSMTTTTDKDAAQIGLAGRRYYLGPYADEGVFKYADELRLTALMNDYVPRIFFLKRLYACFACCGVYYNDTGNSAQIGELWPYPLASVLGHGSRILIRLEDVEASEFLNFLLTGDPEKPDWKDKGMPHPLKARAAATHAVQLQTETGHLLERKLKATNVTDTFENIKDGMNRKHLGLNMPIGGAGNPSPMGLGHIVNFTGKVLQKQADYKKTHTLRGSLTEQLSKVSPFRQREKKQTYERRTTVTSNATASTINATASNNTTAKKSVCGSASPVKGFGGHGDLEASCTMQQTISASSEAPLSPMFQRQPSATSGAGVFRSNLSVDPGQWQRQVKHEEELWRQVPRVQGGHLYIRVDGFGHQVNRHCGADSALHFTTREQRDNQLHEQFRKGIQPLERAILRRTVESKFHKPGEIFFPESVPILPRDRHEHLMGHAQHASEKHAHGATGESHFPRLIRVSSTPSLQMHLGVDAPPEDVIWLNKIFKSKLASYASPVSVMPPSVAALRLLLHHYNPLGTHLFGTSHFKSVEDLFHEIRSLCCCISIDKTGTLQRLVEPVVCQLRFRGRILMQSHHRVEGEEVAVQKHRFITMQLSEDQNWREGLQDVIWAKLGIGGSRESCMETVLNTLECFSRDLEKSHSVIEETMVSPSYPGLLCHYHTHLIQWDIAEDCDLEVFARCGLPLDLESRQNNPYNCDFTQLVAPDDSRTYGKFKTLYWSWVPELEARKLQHWVNLGEATSDDRWARHVFQKQGAVQFPPSEMALTILLQRCGIDIYRFGTGDRSLNAMWRELTNQESTLHMEGGQPVLAIEDVLVLVRWKQKGCENFDVLVQIREEHPDGRVNGNQKLLGGRKLKEESWSSAAMRCVAERTQLKEGQVINILAHRPDDASEYTFVEERQKASTFPDIDTLHRTHLVTYTLKPDITKTYAGRKVLGILQKNYSAQGSLTPASIMRSPTSRDAEMRKFDSGASLLDQEYASEMAEDQEDDIPSERTFEVEKGSEFGESMYEFKWLRDDEPGIQEEVVGMNLFEMAKKREERHRISSVLLGLEGADPGNVSAFGMGHDASGASSKVSACGGRKWRAYRTNHAMQIPADIGGIRMKVNKQMFAEVMSTCEILDLLDPGVDILWEQNVSYPRELLDHRHAEKEFFKQILGGNGLHASKTLAWMKAYRQKYKTPAQVHSGMKLSRPKLRRGKSLNRERNCRTLEESLQEAEINASPRSEHGFTEYIVGDNDGEDPFSSETPSPRRSWSNDMPSLRPDCADSVPTVFGQTLRAAGAALPKASELLPCHPAAAAAGRKASELLPCNPALHDFPRTPRPGVFAHRKATGGARYI